MDEFLSTRLSFQSPPTYIRPKKIHVASEMVDTVRVLGRVRIEGLSGFFSFSSFCSASFDREDWGSWHMHGLSGFRVCVWFMRMGNYYVNGIEGWRFGGVFCMDMRG